MSFASGIYIAGCILLLYMVLVIQILCKALSSLFCTVMDKRSFVLSSNFPYSWNIKFGIHIIFSTIAACVDCGTEIDLWTYILATGDN